MSATESAAGAIERLEIALADADATGALGAALAQALGGARGAVVYLQGELGAGKTTLARGLLRALGVSGTIRSPTYTLMEPYRTATHSVLHIDLYRINDPLELEHLGLGDYPVAETLWLVEWPSRGAPLLPAADLCIGLAVDGAARRASIEGHASLVQALRRAWPAGQ